MNPSIDHSVGKVTLKWPTSIVWLTILTVAIVAVFSFWGWRVGVPVLLVVAAIAAVPWTWSDTIQDRSVQQTILFLLLIVGLYAHFFVAWNLFSSGAISTAQDVTQIQRAGTTLFLPFLGVAVGGVFGVKGFKRKVDVSTFMIAASIIVLWDALAIGNLWAMQITARNDTPGFVGWALEDVIRFADDIMPLVSVLPAAAIGFYFGSQTADTKPETQPQHQPKPSES